MQELTIVFNNGVSQSFKAEDFTVKINNLSGRITELSWEKPENKYPMFINFDEVTAVFVKEDK